MSRQLYGSRDYMRTMLEAMWSLLQACRPLSSCCLTAHRDALSQQEQKHTHTHTHTYVHYEADSAPPSWLSDMAKKHNYTFLFFKKIPCCVSGWKRGFHDPTAVNPLFTNECFIFGDTENFLRGSICNFTWDGSACEEDWGQTSVRTWVHHCAWFGGGEWEKIKPLTPSLGRKMFFVYSQWKSTHEGYR